MKIQFKFPLSRFAVNEESMEPTYKSGDHVLTFNWGRIKRGNVVVFCEGQTNYLKRVERIEDDLVYLSSENKEKASKIWKVVRRQIIGRVVYKY